MVTIRFGAASLVTSWSKAMSTGRWCSSASVAIEFNESSTTPVTGVPKKWMAVSC